MSGIRAMTAVRLPDRLPSPDRAAAMIGVDTGGTFTDLIRYGEDGVMRMIKIPSTPTDPAQSFLEGIREISEELANEDIVHGCTVGVNAILERRGARTALVTTAGFADVIEIGRQTRPTLYDLHVRRPTPLVPRDLRFQVDERVSSEGVVLRAPSDADLEAIADEIARSGAESVAVVLLFSFLRPEQEGRVLETLRQRLPEETQISVSSEILPEFREYERTSTTVMNAYIAPVMQTYLGAIDESIPNPVRIMSSSGGSMTISQARRLPVHTLLSGPAGGVVGAFEVARAAGIDRIMTLDMGGTSTDVSLCEGEIQRTSEGAIGGLPVRVPMVDIHTVGAGGGSLASFDAGGALAVGPQSAGSVPGPAAYGRGGGATVTDANITLGRLPADRPLAGRLQLDGNAARDAFQSIGETHAMGAEDLAGGVVRVANANMKRALRVVSLERGHDPRDFTLVAFGGAGPLHACELADGLGMTRVLVPRYPGVLSALGMLMADVTRDYARTVLLSTGDSSPDSLSQLLADMETAARLDLQAADLSDSSAVFTAWADMRYVGQGYELSIPFDAADGLSLPDRFHAMHQRRFDHSHAGWPTEIVTLRLRATISVPKPETRVESDDGPDSSHALLGMTRIMLDTGEAMAPVINREALRPGNEISGPAVLTQTDATTWLPPEWGARVDGRLNLIVERIGS